MVDTQEIIERLNKHIRSFDDFLNKLVQKEAIDREDFRKAEELNQGVIAELIKIESYIPLIIQVFELTASDRIQIEMMLEKLESQREKFRELLI
ncbi:hypothetical protein [Halalkalibacter flavus]|uniref:hypothetical protein n=1 Tax=Halalkalibacter flavus TaxID=3090668 RepID=UPI002FCB544F